MVDLGNQLGIEDLNAEDINEALEFDDKELTNEDIYEIYEDLKDEEEEDKKPTELTSKQLSEIIQNFQYACDFTRENDPIDDRSSIVIKKVIDDIKCYTEEAKEKLKNKNRQTSLNAVFNFLPSVKAYCRRKDIPLKILLLVENCTCH